MDRTEIAARLIKYAKEFDFYEYADTLEIGQTDEDMIDDLSEKLKDRKFVLSVCERFTQIAFTNLKLAKEILGGF